MKRILSTLSALAIVFAFAMPGFAQDAENPSDVENVEVTVAGDGEITLSWDEATDNEAVTGYQVHYGTASVSEPGQTYDEFEDVGDVTEFTVDDLENGTEYFFSVIAYDEAGNESINWSVETSGTPEADEAEGGDEGEEGGDTPDEDTEAPQVVEAEALNREEVKIEFSEEVVLPAEDAGDAFVIENEDTFEPLEVMEAEFDEEDEDNKTVILTTAVQEADANYKLTVGIEIEDTAGNPMISGTSDTAIFLGSAEEKLEEPEDSEGPTVMSVESVDSTHILVNFNEGIVLDIDPSANFQVTSDDGGDALTVLGVELGANSQGVEDASALVTTTPQGPGNYTVRVSGLADENGNEMTGAERVSFVGVGEAEEDPDHDHEDDPDHDHDEDPEPEFMPAEDVAQFLAEKMIQAEHYIVTLKWQVPEGNAENSDHQNLYMSSDQGANYQKKAELPSEADEYEIRNLEAGEYWFKLTQTDKQGHETEGVITKVILAETGPGMIGLVALSLGLGRIVTRRRKE